MSYTSIVPVSRGVQVRSLNTLYESVWKRPKVHLSFHNNHNLPIKVYECLKHVKLWFKNMYFVGFYSMSNLIVIIFNLLYLVFIVGFDCKGCVLKRENVKTQAIEARRILTGISWLCFPRSEACASHMIGMRRVNIGWRQLCLASISWVRPSRKTPARHSVLLVYTIWYTFSIPTLYIPTLPTNVEEYFWEKTLAKHLES